MIKEEAAAALRFVLFCKYYVYTMDGASNMKMCSDAWRNCRLLIGPFIFKSIIAAVTIFGIVFHILFIHFLIVFSFLFCFFVCFCFVLRRSSISFQTCGQFDVHTNSGSCHVDWPSYGS